MRTIVSSAFAVLFVACGGADPAAACVDYVTAANDCTAEFGATVGTIDETSFCSAYDVLSGAAAEEAETLLNCYAGAYDGADCTTAEGLTAASDAVAACN